MLLMNSPGPYIAALVIWMIYVSDTIGGSFMMQLVGAYLGLLAVTLPIAWLWRRAMALWRRFRRRALPGRLSAASGS